MPTCAGGSEPKPESPDWTTYAAADLPTLFGSIGSWITNSLIGLPSGPVNVADLCALEPEGDLPTEGDALLIGFPVLALAAGVYTRLGNLARRQLWAEMCQCKAVPEECEGANEGNTGLRVIAEGAWQDLYASGDQGGQLLTVLLSGAGAQAGGANNWSGRMDWRNASDVHISYSVEIHGSSGGAGGASTMVTPPAGATGFVQQGKQDGPGSANYVHYWGAEWTYVCGEGDPTPIPEPDPLEPPEDFPTNPGTDCADIGDLCALLNEVRQEQIIMSRVILHISDTADVVAATQLDHTSALTNLMDVLALVDDKVDALNFATEAQLTAAKDEILEALTDGGGTDGPVATGIDRLVRYLTPDNYLSLSTSGTCSGEGTVLLAAGTIAVRLTLTAIPSHLGRVGNDAAQYYLDPGYVMIGEEINYSPPIPIRAANHVIAPLLPTMNVLVYNLRPGVEMVVECMGPVASELSE